MTNEIKKSWFEVHWNNQNKMRRYLRRYYMKRRNVGQILKNSQVYNIPMPDDYEKIVNDKFSFYSRQVKILESMINAYFSEIITEENKIKIIDDVFNGKYYWAKGTNYVGFLPPKNFFKKKRK